MIFRGSGPTSIAKKPFIFVIFQGGGGLDPPPPPLDPPMYFPHVLIKEEEKKLLDDKLLELESQKESKVAAWQAEDQKLKELDVKFTYVMIFFTHVLIFSPMY